MKTPIISIVVTNYNGAKYLRPCIDSLLNQTFDDYDVLLVDKASTDDSLGIMREYGNRFPEKVFVYSLPYSNSPATGRNFGIKKARGKYITFADSDDKMEPDALEQYYRVAEKNNCDFIYAQYYDVRGDKKSIHNKLANPLDIARVMIFGNPAFWNLMLSKDLLLETGPIPEDGIFEDSAYYTKLISHVKRIGHVAKPVYNYLHHDDSSIGVFQTPRFQYIIPASKHMLEDCAPKYKKYAAVKVAAWMDYNIKFRWRFADEFIDFLKEYQDYFIDNDALVSFANGAVYEKLCGFIGQTDEKIPLIVYVNTFGVVVSEERISQIRDNAFNTPADVRILNEENCDVKENEGVYEFYKRGDYAEVGFYFALKRIFTTGGIYVGQYLQVDMAMNALRRRTAFFAYEDRKKYTNEIFGAHAEAEIIGKLQATYDLTEYADSSAAARIAGVLWENGIPQNGSSCVKDNIFVADLYVMSLPRGADMPESEYHFSHLDYAEVVEAGLVAVKNEFILSLAEPAGETKVQYLCLENQKLSLNNEILRAELKEIYNSKAWKIIQKLKDFGNSTAGKPLKNFFWKLFR